VSGVTTDAERGGTSGLLLSTNDLPSPRLASLRRAEAWRLLKLLAVEERALARSLADLARVTPERAVDVLLEPSAAVLARTGRMHDAAGAWAFELARHALLDRSFDLPGVRVVSAPLGLALAWTAGVRVSVSSRGLELSGAGPRRSWPLTREAILGDRDPRLVVTDAFTVLRRRDPHGVIRFARVDANPFAMQEAHPDKEGNALSLGGKDTSEWEASLGDALAMIERHLPSVVDEMASLSMLLVPVGYHAERHLSASYREYVGACYLTLHPNVRTMAEAIVHEYQHNKVNLASYHDALLENGHGTLVRSPVRPDLRPLWGVLLAVHAFVPVAELYRRMLAAGEHGVEERMGDVIARNDEGLRTIREHARPTRVGAMLLSELEALHAEHLRVQIARPGAASWE
jgi:HEXXH motif-containing protein